MRRSGRLSPRARRGSPSRRHRPADGRRCGWISISKAGRGLWSPGVPCSGSCARTTRLRSGCAAWVRPTTSSSSLSTRAGRTSGGTSKRDLQPPARWKHFRIDSREFEFAWGPESGGVLKDLGAIELAIVAGDGGAGTLWVSDLRIEDHDSLTGARASASSALPGFDANQSLGGSGWMPSPDDAQALDCARLHRGAQARWAHHRLAGRRTGERLPGASIVARSALADATHDAPCGRRAQLRLPAEPADALSSAGAQRTVRGRRRCTPSRSSSAVRSRPSATASSGTSRVAGTRAGCIASKPCGRRSGPQTARTASNERGRCRRVGAGSHSRSSRWWRSTAGSLRGRTSSQRQELLEGVLPVPSAIMGNRSVAPAHPGRGNGERARSSALSTREPLGSILDQRAC